MEDRYSLPHGAKGIESEDVAVEFRDGKIVFIVKSAGAGKHYTFQDGSKSGVIDLHETHPRADGQEQHRTLLAVHRDDLEALLGEAAPMLAEFLRLFRRLRLGWLKHRNIVIARGIEPVSDADVAAVTVRRKQRLTIDPDLYERNVFVPEFLEEVYDFPDGNFSLFHRGRPIGWGFKNTDQEGIVRLFWIKRRDLLRFGRDGGAKLASTLESIAIPPDRYLEYPFLRSGD